MARKTRRQHQGIESAEGDAVVILNRQRCRPVDRDALTRFAQRVLVEIGRGHHQATVTLVSDQKIRELNRIYRALDQPTDVLAFPDAPGFPHDAGDLCYLGDVVISTETAAREAANCGLSFDREVRQLIIHGLLHLCGYDHETDHGEMKQLERRLRRKLIASEL